MSRYVTAKVQSRKSSPISQLLIVNIVVHLGANLALLKVSHLSFHYGANLVHLRTKEMDDKKYLNRLSNNPTKRCNLCILQCQGLSGWIIQKQAARHIQKEYTIEFAEETISKFALHVREDAFAAI